MRITWLTKKHELLFHTTVHYIHEAGGDGDGWIVSEDFAQLARLFWEFEKRHGRRFTKESEPLPESYPSDCDHIVFSCKPEESIWFVSPDYELPSWAGDIIVQIDD